ncbi:unnamed protein product [Merluccius merluccius]
MFGLCSREVAQPRLQETLSHPGQEAAEHLSRTTRLRNSFFPEAVRLFTDHKVVILRLLSFWIFNRPQLLCLAASARSTIPLNQDKRDNHFTLVYLDLNFFCSHQSFLYHPYISDMSSKVL